MGLACRSPELAKHCEIVHSAIQRLTTSLRSLHAYKQRRSLARMRGTVLLELSNDELTYELYGASSSISFDRVGDTSGGHGVE